MSSPLHSPAINAWIFSERCQGCESVVSAAFCNDEFCRRKFVLASDRTHLYCPLHDTALSPERVPETMKGAVHCPTCHRNLYGVKAEDRL